MVQKIIKWPCVYYDAFLALQGQTHIWIWSGDDLRCELAWIQLKR